MALLEVGQIVLPTSSTCDVLMERIDKQIKCATLHLCIQVGTTLTVTKLDFGVFAIANKFCL